MAHPATAYSDFPHATHPSPQESSAPDPPHYTYTYTDSLDMARAQLQQPRLLQQRGLLNPALGFPAHQLHEYQDQHAAQVAAPWPENMGPAMDMQSNGPPALPAGGEYLQDHFSYSNQNLSSDYAALQSAHENRSSYSALGYDLHRGEPELNFRMTELVDIPPIPEGWEFPDAEGEDYEEEEEATEAEEGEGEVGDGDGGSGGNEKEEQETTSAIPSSDSGYHDEVQVQDPQEPQEPQQKVYLRFKNLKEHKEASMAMVHEKTQEAVSAKKRKATQPSEGLLHARDQDDMRQSKKPRIESEDFVPSSSPPLPAPTLEHTRLLSMKGDHAVPPFSPTLPNSDVDRSAPYIPKKAKSTTPTNKRKETFKEEIPDDIVELFNSLKDYYHNVVQFKVLPGAQDANDKDIPWTAERLFFFYIYSCSQGETAFCDLVVDLWIRAFQQRDRKELKANKGTSWKTNKHHCERKYYGSDPGTPRMPLWQKEHDLPTLGKDVTGFDPRLLNQLFYYTDEDNGARKLWGDAFVLAGTKAEDFLIKTKKDKIQLHPDLLFAVATTGLRAFRRHLTLKMEEVGEESWCQRYHMHPKLKQPCHRSQEMEELRQAQSAQATAEDDHGDQDGEFSEEE